MELINKNAVIGSLNVVKEIAQGDLHMLIAVKSLIETINEMPTVDAVPSQLTNEEIETIRIHMNAHKETLCNQHRWKEAEEYQQIVDKLDTMMDEVGK